MLLHSIPVLVAQISDEAQWERNHLFLWAGLIAAWVILMVYILLLASRERKLKREISSLRAMLEDRPKPSI